MYYLVYYCFLAPFRLVLALNFDVTLKVKGHMS